jgi:hypothetical protein
MLSYTSTFHPFRFSDKNIASKIICDFTIILFSEENCKSFGSSVGRDVANKPYCINIMMLSSTCMFLLLRFSDKNIACKIICDFIIILFSEENCKSFGSSVGRDVANKHYRINIMMLSSTCMFLPLRFSDKNIAFKIICDFIILLFSEENCKIQPPVTLHL